jgi:hypothetical protein
MPWKKNFIYKNNCLQHVQRMKGHRLPQQSSKCHPTVTSQRGRRLKILTDDVIAGTWRGKPSGISSLLDDDDDDVVMFLYTKHTVTFEGCDYRRGMNWMIGFTDTLYTALGTTGIYSAIADLQTLQFISTHTLGFSVFTSRILATDL